MVGERLKVNFAKNSIHFRQKMQGEAENGTIFANSKVK